MDATIKKICEGDVRTASRLIRDIEDKLPEARAKICMLCVNPQGRKKVSPPKSMGAAL